MVNRERSSVAVGFINFAGVVLIVAGIFHVIQGIVGLADNDFYVVSQKWVFQFNVTTWGWVHILIGIIAILAGAGLFSGAVWARTVAVIVAGISIIANFVWLPYYPLLPGVGLAHHRRRFLRDLGAGPARTRRHRGLSPANAGAVSEERSTATNAAIAHTAMYAGTAATGARWASTVANSGAVPPITAAAMP